MSRASANVGFLVLAVVCACAKQPPRDVQSTTASATQNVRMTTGRSLSDFVADVPAYEADGVCQARSTPMRGRDVGMLFRHGKTAARMIWLTYDDSGALINYSDVRGDLMRKVAGPDGGPPQQDEAVRIASPKERQTAIDISLKTGWGMASNEGGGRPVLRVAGRSDVMLKAANLGTPANMIELIQSRCSR